MRQYFDFSRIIKKYGKEIIVDIPTEGYIDEAGDWQKAEPERITIFGAAINHRESKIFRSEGKLTSKDKALYMLEPLKNALHGAKIIDEGKVFSIGDELQNGEFTGVWAYTLKFVSAFKETRPSYDITEEIEDLEDRLDGILVETEEKPIVSDLTKGKKCLEKRLDGVLIDD